MGIQCSGNGKRSMDELIIFQPRKPVTEREEGSREWRDADEEEIELEEWVPLIFFRLADHILVHCIVIERERYKSWDSFLFLGQSELNKFPKFIQFMLLCCFRDVTANDLILILCYSIGKQDSLNSHVNQWNTSVRFPKLTASPEIFSKRIWRKCCFPVLLTYDEDARL